MKRLFGFMLLAVLLFGCGTGLEPTGEAHGALVPSPYLCAPLTWNPSAHPFPAVGWCNWQPDAAQDAGNTPPSVHACGARGPQWGEAYLYSGPAWTGECATAWTYGGTSRLVADYAFVELNGWWAWANGQWTQIRSMRVGGSAPWGGVSTTLVVTDGATANPPAGAPYHACTFTNDTPGPLDIPSYPSCTGHAFGITSFTLSAE